MTGSASANESMRSNKTHWDNSTLLYWKELNDLSQSNMFLPGKVKIKPNYTSLTGLEPEDNLIKIQTWAE